MFRCNSSCLAQEIHTYQNIKTSYCIEEGHQDHIGPYFSSSQLLPLSPAKNGWSKLNHDKEKKVQNGKEAKQQGHWPRFPSSYSFYHKTIHWIGLTNLPHVFFYKDVLITAWLPQLWVWLFSNILLSKKSSSLGDYIY